MSKETPSFPPCWRPANPFASFIHAGNGLIYTITTQRNFRFQCFAAAVVLYAGFLCRLPVPEMLLLALLCGIVLVVELINTAIEAAVDLMTAEFHPLAKIAKDVAAGAVLLSAGIAVVGGYLIFVAEGHLFLLWKSLVAGNAAVPVLVVVAFAVVFLSPAMRKGNKYRPSQKKRTQKWCPELSGTRKRVPGKTRTRDDRGSSPGGRDRTIRYVAERIPTDTRITGIARLSRRKFQWRRKALSGSDSVVRQGVGRSVEEIQIGTP